MSAARFLADASSEVSPPLRITMQHHPRGDLAIFEERFHCAVAFDAEQDALIFPSGWVNGPVHAPDRMTHRFITGYLDERLPNSSCGPGLAARVAAVLDSLIPMNQARLDYVAEQMNAHPRTLQRKLEKEGTSFSELLEQRRKLIAEQLITQVDLPLVQVAHYLGYADQSAFNHAFERWYGISPTRWRSGR